MQKAIKQHVLERLFSGGDWFLSVIDSEQNAHFILTQLNNDTNGITKQVIKYQNTFVILFSKNKPSNYPVC